MSDPIEKQFVEAIAKIAPNGKLAQAEVERFCHEAQKTAKIHPACDEYEWKRFSGHVEIGVESIMRNIRNQNPTLPQFIVEIAATRTILDLQKMVPTDAGYMLSRDVGVRLEQRVDSFRIWFDIAVCAGESEPVAIIKERALKEKRAA